MVCDSTTGDARRQGCPRGFPQGGERTTSSSLFPHVSLPPVRFPPARFLVRGFPRSSSRERCFRRRRRCHSCGQLQNPKISRPLGSPFPSPRFTRDRTLSTGPWGRQRRVRAEAVTRPPRKRSEACRGNGSASTTRRRTVEKVGRGKYPAESAATSPFA